MKAAANPQPASRTHLKRTLLLVVSYLAVMLAIASAYAS